MIKLYSPRTEGEAALLKSVLDAARIPYFVHNDYFASLRIGPQIDLLNMKTFMVPDDSRERAQDLILDYLETITANPKPLLLRDKVRVVLEFLIFHWFVPGRMRAPKHWDQLDEDGGRTTTG